MAIAVGDKLPDAELLFIGENGPSTVSVSEISKDKKIIIFGLPGAYTGTCTTKHIPSFIAVADDLRAKGVDGIYCVTVNDPFVTDTWADSTGARAAGIEILADSASDFTKAIGLNFTALPVGFYDRCKRFASIVENGVVTAIGIDENPGECSLSSGMEILDQL